MVEEADLSIFGDVWSCCFDFIEEALLVLLGAGRWSADRHNKHPHVGNKPRTLPRSLSLWILVARSGQA